MTIGKRLLEYRRLNNLSQEEMAEKLEVTRQTISKWETDQSSPDFDKIAPLCELFNISADELITGKKPEIPNTTRTNKPIKGIVVSISVFIYFISIIWIILGSEVYNLNEGILVSIFMFLCAIATCILIFYFTTYEKKEKNDNQANNYNSIKKAIKNILALITTAIYFLISFSTMAWNFTWIIWLIYGAFTTIIDLWFDLRGGK